MHIRAHTNTCVNYLDTNVRSEQGLYQKKQKQQDSNPPLQNGGEMGHLQPTVRPTNQVKAQMWSSCSPIISEPGPVHSVLGLHRTELTETAATDNTHLKFETYLKKKNLKFETDWHIAIMER